MFNLIFKKKKFFGIGFNKIGTTTLEEVFKKLKYNIPNQQDQEYMLRDAFFLKDIKKIKKFIDQYDFFQDLPISQLSNYVILDYLYPNAKFILTIRDEDKWVCSLQRFMAKILSVHNPQVKNIDDITKQMFLDFDYIYPGYLHEMGKRYIVQDLQNCEINYDFNVYKNKEFLKKIYTARNLEIIKYFQLRKEKLLIIDITKEKDISKILKFCNLPSKYNFKMPHLNSSS